MTRIAALAFATGLVAAVAAPAMAQPAPVPMLMFTQPLAPGSVQVVQDRLRQQGLYTGRVDGVWGGDSQAALTQFQQTHELQVTGQMNQATAALLGLDPAQLLAATAQPAAPPPPPPQGVALSRNAVRTLQERLQQLGYYTAAIDGEWGPAAIDALRRYQEASGIQVTGRINSQTVTALGIDPTTLTQR